VVELNSLPLDRSHPHHFAQRLGTCKSWNKFENLNYFLMGELALGRASCFFEMKKRYKLKGKKTKSVFHNRLPEEHPSST
jgi:hypothetical protein